jgi:hypothetical protein
MTEDQAMEKALDQAVARMKDEILDDMAQELVPRTCASFSELHDYVDANCYGGFCGMEFSQQYGHPSEDGYPQELVDLISKAQSIIDTWLRDGGTNSNQSCVSETQQGETK